MGYPACRYRPSMQRADPGRHWYLQCCFVSSLSGVPDLWDRIKILSGGDLSHYQVPHCIRVFFYFVWLCLFITIFNFILNYVLIVTFWIFTYHRVPTNKPRKISMIIQWYFKTKIPKFHDNSERHKTENHRTTCYAWPPYTPYVHYWVLLRKSVKVFLFHLMKSISVNNTCKIHIYLPRWLVKTTSISEFNDFSMSDWSKIQWFFPRFCHSYKFHELFVNFNDFSMILKQIRISMIFQELWEPCIIKFEFFNYLFYMKLLNYLFFSMFGSVLECCELTGVSLLWTGMALANKAKIGLVFF